MTTTSRSTFTDAIEDHLALKKQNAALAATMPLEAFNVGDPLDRYPGGPVTPVVEAVVADDEATMVGPNPAAAVAAADELAAPGELVEAEFRQPLQPLNGMTPMLSLVEDVEDDEDATLFDAPSVVGLAAPAAGAAAADQGGSVVRFPGGAGPRVSDEAVAEATGEQPVILIDADEPLASIESVVRTPLEPRPLSRIKRPSFFGLRRRRKDDDMPEGDGWFANSPRDFDWND